VPGSVFTLQVPTSSPWHGKTLELVELRWYNLQPVAFFKDVPDRTAAESLLKAILWIDQDLDQGTDEEDAWFDHQLVGLSVVRDGAVIGRVARLDHLPSQDLLHVERSEGDVVLVPFVKAIVPSVDIEAGTLTVTPPPGLFEELESDDADALAAAGAKDAASTDAEASEATPES
jgi:16S rRNA processing protein RimM